MNFIYKNKYLKYKNKYLELKRKQFGGSDNFSWFIKDGEQEEKEVGKEVEVELENKYNLGQAVEISFEGETFYITPSGKYQYQNKLLRRQQKIININEDEHTLFNELKACATKQCVILRVAGGWVRDKILQLPNDDIDIAVDIITGKTFSEHLFKHINDLGGDWMCSQAAIIAENAEKSKNLETATLKLKIPNGKVFELDFVGLRKEVYDNPASRVPTVKQATVEEDAMRRDLTINSLFYNINTDIIEDYIGGVRDIHRKVIRTPLNPIRTFNDDPLRILRALRFLCRFRFTLDKDTEFAMEDQEIKNKLGTIISKERIGEEILGFFKVGSDPLLGFNKIFNNGLWNIIFGGEGDWDCESMILIERLENKSLINMLATLTYPLYLKDIGKCFRLNEKTSVDNCFSFKLRLKKEFEIIVGKIHKCIFKIIDILGKKDPKLWKPSDIALIIIDVDEYLNNVIDVGKTINKELFIMIEVFINENNLRESYKKQPFDSRLVRKTFNLSDGRKVGVLFKILLAWQFDNPEKKFEDALKLKENFLCETEEIAYAEDILFVKRKQLCKLQVSK